MGNLLQQSVQLATAVGLVRVKDVAIDGTKVKTSASKHRALRDAHLQARETALQAEIQGYLDQLEAHDQADDAVHGADQDGWSAPPGLADAQHRLAPIRGESPAGGPSPGAGGRGPRGEGGEARGGGKTSPATPRRARDPDPKAQTNFTDPDSRIMRNSEKAFIPGYNAHVAVDADSPIILAATVTNQGADSPHLLAVLDEVAPNTGRKPRGVLADAGYWSEHNLDGCAERQVPAAIPPEKVRHRAWRTATAPRSRIPQSRRRLTAWRSPRTPTLRSCT